METVTKYQNREYEWFSKRVGKKVYRKGDETPILIKDLAHACFLFDGQIDFKHKYSDEK